MTLHCLHGFLGLPSDWDEFQAALGGLLPEFRARGSFITPDLFGADAFPETESIPAWADAYYRREAETTSAIESSSRCLLGYSLGGRLALHLAVQYPASWDKVIIVGANPGLDSAEARQQRRSGDEIWAQRFETEPWDTLLAAWDAQPVFAGGGVPRERREKDFSRAGLAGALRRWSLGGQQPLWPELRAIPCPVLWVAGAADTGQIPICRRVQDALPGAEVWAAPCAGHRVPWDQPAAFAEHVAGFLESSQNRHFGG